MPEHKVITKIKQSFIDNDMFGHSIALNFQNQGDSHNTLIGGFFSTLIRGAFAIYIYLIFKKMVMMEGNMNQSVFGSLEFENEPPVSLYKDSHLRPLVYIEKQNGGDASIAGGILNYLTITF